MLNRIIMFVVLSTTLLATLSCAQTVSDSGLFSCFKIPAIPTKNYIISLINLVSSENIYGACALEGLSIYNTSGALSKYNISINFTHLNKNFFAGNPFLPSQNISNAILFNSTSLKITKPEEICIKYTPESNNANSNADRTHIHTCTPGLLKNSDIIFNITTASNVIVLPPPRGPIIINTSLTNLSINSSDAQPYPIWAGYQVGPKNSSALVDSISGSWIVQKALSSQTERASYQWLGISAPSGINMVQIGTVSCYKSVLYPCNNSTNASYGVILEYVNSDGVPTPLYVPNFSIHGGDKITATINITSAL